MRQNDRFRHRHVGAIAHRLAFAQRGIKRQRMAIDAEIERKGQIDLVAVPVGNPGLDLLDLVRVVAFGKCCAQFGHTGPAQMFGQTFLRARQQFIDLLRIECLAPTEKPCAQAFSVALRTTRSHLERRAQPVVRGQHHPLAGSRSRFDARKQHSRRRPALIGRHGNLLAAVVGQQMC